MQGGTGGGAYSVLSHRTRAPAPRGSMSNVRLVAAEVWASIFFGSGSGVPWLTMSSVRLVAAEVWASTVGRGLGA